jgi:hypothetical protein
MTRLLKKFKCELFRFEKLSGSDIHVIVFQHHIRFSQLGFEIVLGL